MGFLVFRSQAKQISPSGFPRKCTSHRVKNKQTNRKNREDSVTKTDAAYTSLDLLTTRSSLRLCKALALTQGAQEEMPPCPVSCTEPSDSLKHISDVPQPGPWPPATHSNGARNRTGKRLEESPQMPALRISLNGWGQLSLWVIYPHCEKQSFPMSFQWKRFTAGSGEPMTIVSYSFHKIPK